MKILIVGGFLGSGKTSVILKLARYLVSENLVQHIAILENEIGEVGIDDQVLKSSGLQVRGLFAGCVCCTLAGELPVTVRAIETELSPDLLIIEATGVAFPCDIRENLEHNLEKPAAVLCVVDAKRWPRLHKPLEHLFTYQLKDADVILINKAAAQITAAGGIIGHIKFVLAVQGQACPVHHVSSILSIQQPDPADKRQFLRLAIGRIYYTDDGKDETDRRYQPANHLNQPSD